MSIDRSLRSSNMLERHRNVLTRAERVAKLMEDERFSDELSPLGLPKVAHRKVQTGKKKEKAKTEEATATETPATE